MTPTTRWPHGDPDEWPVQPGDDDVVAEALEDTGWTEDER